MPPLLHLDQYPHTWTVQLLSGPPLIAPSRQYTYPMSIAGEEDALARGALYLLVRPAPGEPAFLATCALGYRDPSMPTGVYATPNPSQLCAVAGGYAYLIDPTNPTQSTHIDQRPVTAVLPTQDLLLFAGFHTIQAWGNAGLAWTTQRLTWDGITLGEATNGVLHGTGWNMRTDKEVPFEIDLKTGTHTGGGF
ncbi:hypothetical protein SAMN05421771_3842 [Granulicella pectinivorans]|uniref:Uncharacterized protein n=1 Tax=Granulicella pectinivorans TaxID=474950 RepID=A0A1I6MYP6_9BACT|nr:hypothetical protein [Granulicella pectinivorans]SFS20799.1 hypothetical protein SAMN05421771_3842 [Granulicella pectinivorans]